MNKINIGTVNEFELNQVRVVRAGGASVLVLRTEDGFYAAANHCPHLGLPIANGKLEGCVITCPFHGSKFDLRTGENLDWVTSFAGAKLPSWSRRLMTMGKKPAPLETFPVSVQDGSVWVSL